MMRDSDDSERTVCKKRTQFVYSSFQFTQSET